MTEKNHKGTNYVAIFYIKGELEKVTFASKMELADFLYAVTDGISYEDVRVDEKCRYVAWNGKKSGELNISSFAIDTVILEGDDELIDFCMKKHGPFYGMTPVLMVNEQSQELLGTTAGLKWQGTTGGEMISTYKFYSEISRREKIRAREARAAQRRGDNAGAGLEN